MKKAVGVGVLILVIGGVTAFLQYVDIVATVFAAFISFMVQLPGLLPTNIFEVIQMQIENTWSLTNIEWLDSMLLGFATFVPSIASFLISKFSIRLNWIISGLISLLIFALVLQLFSSPVFWVVIGVVLVLTIGLSIYLFIKRRKETPVDSVCEECVSTEKTDEAREEIVIIRDKYTCPICNSRLKKRKGPYGYFWGCSSYPGCVYTTKEI